MLLSKETLYTFLFCIFKKGRSCSVDLLFNNIYPNHYQQLLKTQLSPPDRHHPAASRLYIIHIGGWYVSAPEWFHDLIWNYLSQNTCGYKNTAALSEKVSSDTATERQSVIPNIMSWQYILLTNHRSVIYNLLRDFSWHSFAAAEATGQKQAQICWKSCVGHVLRWKISRSVLESNQMCQFMEKDAALKYILL